MPYPEWGNNVTVEEKDGVFIIYLKYVKNKKNLIKITELPPAKKSYIVNNENIIFLEILIILFFQNQ